MLRQLLVAVVIAGCGASLTPATSPAVGRVAAAYDVVPFPGGAVHVRLTNDTSMVAEWVTEDFAFPVSVAIERTTTSLHETTAVTHAVLQPRTPVRIALWDITDRQWHEHTLMHVTFGDPKAAATPYIYALPFSAGETHRLMQGFNGTFSHTGEDAYALDFEMPEGTAIRAARDGTVVGFNDLAEGNGLTPEWRDRSKANWILILHTDGTIGEYWHLQTNGVRVKIGQRVARGDLLGLSGFTGFTTSPHLHFEVRVGIDGLRVKSFAFVMRLRADAPDGETPAQGTSYTAFE